jgi:apolipoprotein N-acyltransferase
VWLAAAWTAMESLRSTWPFSGMPWGRVSFAMIDTPVASAATYVGLTGLSFLLALVGFLLADLVGLRLPGGAAAPDAVRRLPRLPVAAALVGVVALLVLPTVRPYQVDTTGTAVVAAVQGDLPGPPEQADNILWDHREVTRNHVEATEELADDVASGAEPRPDFVLWPENATAVDPFLDGEVNGGIREAASSIGVPVVVGGLVDSGPEHVLNQGIVWDPVTGPGDRYTKQHPVPYGEYIPFRDLWNPQFGRLSEISRDMRSGTRTSPLQVAGIDVADAICFDVAYDDVFREQLSEGAELLTVQSSNASFIFTHQIEQQFAITRLRAIESGRWLVVATPNGRSGVIAPDGTVVATADPRTSEVIVEQVGLVDQLTPAIRLGAWPARVFTGLSLLGLALGVLVSRRGRDRAGSSRVSEEQPSPDPSPTPSEAGVA